MFLGGSPLFLFFFWAKTNFFRGSTKIWEGLIFFIFLLVFLFRSKNVFIRGGLIPLQLVTLFVNGT